MKQPASLELVQQLCDIDSGSSEKEILAFIERQLQEHDIEFIRMPVSEERYNILARRGSGSDGLLLAGHCDTVQSEPHYHSYVQEGVLHGLGASDMKGGLGACLHHFLHAETDRKLGLLVTVGEETTLDGARATLDHAEEFESFSSAIVAEPSDLCIFAGQYGMAQIQLDVEGMQRHTAGLAAGNQPVHDLIGMLAPLVADFKKEFSHCILSTNRIQAGGEADNIIPQQAQALVDVRVAPHNTLEEMRRFFASYLDHYEKGHWKEPVPIRENTLIHTLQRQLEDPTLYPIKAFTEMYFYHQLGLDTVVFGPGILEAAHKVNETLPLSNLLRFEAVLKKLL